MYITGQIATRVSFEGGPECVSTADNSNYSPGGDDLIATPGSAE